MGSTSTLAGGSASPYLHGTEWPSVSVIVPTRNRAPYLPFVLDALAAQVYSAGRMEVIVIDNSSTDDTEEIVSEAAERAPFPIRYVRKDDEGPAASRNRGASLAAGEFLAFTDSDCIPNPGWIRSAILEFDSEVGIVSGPIAPLDGNGDSPFFMHQIHEANREDGLYPTANVFYRRAVFQELGGFDESFRTYAWGQPVGGDDTDLAWRVRRAGYGSAFAQQALVLHQATPVGPRAYLLEALAAQVVPRLVKTVPELRKTCFYRRYFLHRQSATFYLFVAGILLTRLTRWGGLLTLPWLWSTWPAIRTDVWPPRRWWRAALRLVLLLESSALLAAALAYGSIRHRRLVL